MWILKDNTEIFRFGMNVFQNAPWTHSLFVWFVLFPRHIFCRTYFSHFKAALLSNLVIQDLFSLIMRIIIEAFSRHEVHESNQCCDLFSSCDLNLTDYLTSHIWEVRQLSKWVKGMEPSLGMWLWRSWRISYNLNFPQLFSSTRYCAGPGS